MNESFSDKVIKTNIDGYTEDYAIEDVVPKQNQDGTIDVNLYKGIQDNWDQKLTKNNGVKTKTLAQDAIVGALA